MSKRIPIFCLLLMFAVNTFKNRIGDTAMLVIILGLLTISISATAYNIKNEQNPAMRKKKWIIFSLCLIIPAIIGAGFAFFYG